jgi:UDP-glucose 4-epimerase
MRRIVVVGGASPLGRRIIDRLREDPAVECARGVETRARRALDFEVKDSMDEIEIVPIVPDHRPFVKFLQSERIDTIVQCAVALDRCGSASQSSEADVITTMGLGTATTHPGSGIRNWVLLSSSAIYPIESRSSLLQCENQEAKHEGDQEIALLGEAEDYARDVARRHTHISVAILRLQQLIGPGVRGPLSALISESLVPTPIGFDPPIQFLHVEDAASAASFATIHELAGVYNVASAGMIHWHDALRILDRQTIPVLPLSVSFVEPILRRLKIPFVPARLLDLLRFGHALDTEKIERTGWRPEFDQRRCLRELRADR